MKAFLEDKIIESFVREEVFKGGFWELVVS